MKLALWFQQEPARIGLFIPAGAVLLLLSAALPMASRIRERQAQLLQLQARLTEAQALVDRRAQEERALAQARADVEAVSQRIGPDQSVARALELLTQRAKAARLEAVAVQPRAGEHAERHVRLEPGLLLREIPLQLGLSGRYRQIAEFLGALTDLPLVTSIERLALAKVAAGGRDVSAEVVVDLYLVVQGLRP